MSEKVLMSIQPRHAAAILDGLKTVELRRRKPAFGPGTTVLIYASAPDQLVSGRFEVGEVLSANLDTLWEAVGCQSGVTRAEFDAYFDGCLEGHAIEVRNARRVRPRPLRFRPPQSWQYLRRDDSRHRRLLAVVGRA